MKITKVTLEDLPNKHYKTKLTVSMLSGGYDYPMEVSIYGYGPSPSHRELQNGWKPDHGMDHVESSLHLFLAEAIYSKLMFEKLFVKETKDD
jgi:hypothetical protein